MKSKCKTLLALNSLRWEKEKASFWAAFLQHIIKKGKRCPQKCNWSSTWFYEYHMCETHANKMELWLHSIFLQGPPFETFLATEMFRTKPYAYSKVYLDTRRFKSLDFTTNNMFSTYTTNFPCKYCFMNKMYFFEWSCSSHGCQLFLKQEPWIQANSQTAHQVAVKEYNHIQG